MKQFNNIMLLFLFGLAALAQTAQAVDKADVTLFSSRLAVSPYAQAVPNDSYTFIGVSHPSLDSALTQIGVAVEVIDMTTTVNTPSGRAAVFTVEAGETHRVFVVNQGHSTINSSNAAFTDARTHIIPTVNSAQFGSIRVTSVSERPQLASTARDVTLQNGALKYDDVSQLSIWGIVYTQASGTGFAMEFIGDMHDSTLGGELMLAVPSRMNGCIHNQSDAGCKGIASGNSDQSRPGRGIN
tara:strand:+ start:696 stop:1418 length:723 start_codon:yes stop_codon:yes gene_type:complete